MELIKKTILLEESVDRNYNSSTYGLLTATSFYVNIMLTQNIDDMGMFTDIIYIPNFVGQNVPVDYGVLITKLQSSGITFPFMLGITPQNVAIFDLDTRLTGKQTSDYYTYGTVITATTESRIEEVKSYDNNQPYRLNFDTESETYLNFSGGTVSGVNRITRIGEPMTYVFDADKNDTNIGTINQNNGFVFNDFSGTNQTTISYIGQGWNQTNITLSAITKEEYLFGIISKPEVKNDVFIDRGITTVFEKHLKLSEIRTLDELQRYGRGYFNVTKY